MQDTHIGRSLADADRPLLSFEFFPPKDEATFERLRRTVAQLRVVRPDFVSVTYGAGGSTRQSTLDVCRLLDDLGFCRIMPHLTCVGSGVAELQDIADQIHRAGYRNIMALRGDPPRGDTTFQPHPGGLRHADELVALLKTRHSDICCGVAGYPEVHPAAESPASDIFYLRQKLDAGADFVTTQLFYENAAYYTYVDRCRAAGIDHPIIPGLLPATSLRQAQRITRMCGAALPDALAHALERAGDDDAAAADVGIRWVADQMRDLLAAGVPGIHMYILNRAETGLAPAILDQFPRT